VRGCRGLTRRGADLVAVSPPSDVSGNTSQLAANLLYERLCVLPGVKYA
ncbi:arginase family protein, partial [Klebsiella pneumoniae]|nr:agmatinase [Klebsiella pneumoniae]